MLGTRFCETFEFRFVVTYIRVLHKNLILFIHICLFYSVFCISSGGGGGGDCFLFGRLVGLFWLHFSAT